MPASTSWACRPATEAPGGCGSREPTRRAGEPAGCEVPARPITDVNRLPQPTPTDSVIGPYGGRYPGRSRRARPKPLFRRAIVPAAHMVPEPVSSADHRVSRSRNSPGYGSSRGPVTKARSGRAVVHAASPSVSRLLRVDRPGTAHGLGIRREPARSRAWLRLHRGEPDRRAAESPMLELSPRPGSPSERAPAWRLRMPRPARP